MPRLISAYSARSRLIVSACPASPSSLPPHYALHAMKLSPNHLLNRVGEAERRVAPRQPPRRRGDREHAAAEESVRPPRQARDHHVGRGRGGRRIIALLHTTATADDAIGVADLGCPCNSTIYLRMTWLSKLPTPPSLLLHYFARRLIHLSGRMCVLLLSPTM